MTIFEYNDYKSFVNEWILLQEKGGRGLYSKMAQFLRVNTVTISQIFKGSRELNPDQAFTLAQFLELGSKEREYLILLVHMERAGTQDLKEYYQQSLEKIKEEAKDIAKRIDVKEQLPDEAKAQYYSDWLYGAIRMYAARDDIHSYYQIAELLQLEPQKLESAYNFLIEHGLVIEKDNSIELGLRSTHLGSTSPFINNHRRNWRILGMQKMIQKDKEHLFYSAPMVVSVKDAAKIREKIVNFIAEITKDVGSSTCEKTTCLNIDWFSF